MIKAKIVIEPALFTKFSKFAGDYIEFFLLDGHGFLASESIDTHVNLEVKIESCDNVDFSIRVTKDIINNLSPGFLEFIIDNSHIHCIYYDVSGSFMFKILKNKQTGYIQFIEKLELVQKINQASSCSSNALINQCNLFNKLGLNMSCYKHYIYAEKNHAYIIRHMNNLPNFNISSKFLRGLLTASERVFFIQNYIYCLVDKKIHLFVSKYRIPDNSCIVEELVQQKFLTKATIDLSNFMAFRSKSHLTIDDLCVLDLPHKSINVIDKDGMTSTVAVKVSDVDSLTKKQDTSNEFSLAGLANPYQLEKVVIPTWILDKAIGTDIVSLYTNSNQVCLTLGTGCGLIYFPKTTYTGEDA